MASEAAKTEAEKDYLRQYRKNVGEIIGIGDEAFAGLSRWIHTIENDGRQGILQRFDIEFDESVDIGSGQTSIMGRGTGFFEG